MSTSGPWPAIERPKEMEMTRSEKYDGYVMELDDRFLDKKKEDDDNIRTKIVIMNSKSPEEVYTRFHSLCMEFYKYNLADTKLKKRIDKVWTRTKTKIQRISDLTPNVPLIYDT